MNKDNWFYAPLLAMVFIMVLGFWASVAFAGTVALEWDASPSPDVAGYKLFYRTVAQEDYNYDVAIWPTDNIPDPALTATITIDEDGYIVAKAYDTAGLPSADSNEVFADGISGPEPPGTLRKTSQQANIIINGNIQLSLVTRGVETENETYYP